MIATRVTYLLATLFSMLGVVTSLMNLQVNTNGTSSLVEFTSEQGFFNVTVPQMLLTKKYFILQTNSPREVVLLYGSPRDMKIVGSGVGSLVHVSPMSEIAAKLSSSLGFRVQVKQPKESSEGPSFNVTLKIFVEDHVEITGNNSQKLFLHEIDELPIEYKVPVDPYAYKTRFQLVSPHLGEPALITALVNFDKPSYPTLDSHDFKLHHVDAHKLAFMACKDEKNGEFFCIPSQGTSCTYKISLKMENKHLPWIFLDAHHVPVREPLALGKNYYDFYPKFGVRIYSVNVSDPKYAEMTVKVKLNTIHGSPSLFVNPEFVPEYVERSVWKSTDLSSSYTSKSISIGASERITKLHNISILYIMVNAPTPSAYMIQVDVVPESGEALEHLAFNEVEISFLDFQTVKNFELVVSRIGTNSEKEADIKQSKLKIEAKQLGDGKLDIFGFLRSPNSPKTLSLEQVMASNNTIAQIPNLVKNDVSQTQKSIKLDFLCDAKTAIESRVIDHKLTEHICLVTVTAVVWSPYKLNQTSQQQSSKARFQIRALSQTVHQKLFWNHAETLKLAENEQKLLQINLHQGQSVGIDAIKAKIQMLYGKVTLFIDDQIGSECKDSLVHQVAVQLEGRQLHETLINQESKIKLNEISTALYVCIMAKRMSELSLEFTPNLKPEYKEFGQLQLSMVRNIAPEEQLTGEISNIKEPLTFRFHANLQRQVQQDKSEAFIKIHLTALRGNPHYRIVATNLPQIPKSDQPFWNVVGDTLVISAADLNFQAVSEYLVAIYGLPDQISRSASAPQVFNIAYTIGSRHVTLTPGVVFSSEIGTKHQQLYLKATIPPGSQNFTFMKSSTSAADYEVSFSFDMKNQYPFVQQSNINIMLGSWGLFLDAPKLKSYCPHIEKEPCTVFVGLRSFAPSINPLVAFTYDEHPIIIKDENVMMIPAPTRADVQMTFVYHIPVERIKESFTLSIQQYYSPFRVYIDFITETELATKTKFSDFPSSTRNIIARDATMINQIEIEESYFHGKPVALISLVSEKLPVWLQMYTSDASPFNFHYAGKLSTFHHVNELQSGVRQTFESRNLTGTWQYFKFHHSTSDNILVSIENIANICWLSIAKSKEVRPTNAKYLARSFSNMEDDITISPEMLPPGEKIEGHYFISVYCSKPQSKYSLLYRPDSGNYLHVFMNVLTQVKLYRDQENYLEFSNYQVPQNIKIGIKCIKSSLQVYVKSINPEDLSRSLDPQSRSTFRPTITNYHFKAVSTSVGGVTFLTIPTSSEFYCATCKFVVLVETDQDEKIDVFIRKTLPMQPISLMNGQDYIGSLENNEVELWTIFTPPFASVNALQLRALKGKLTLQYSDSLDFPADKTATVHQYQNDEQFRLNFQPKAGLPYGQSTQKFIRIIGANEGASQYTITYMQNNQVEQISPMITQKVSMGSDFTKFYYFPANSNYTTEIKMMLAYMWNGNFLDFKEVRSLLPKFVTFYYADNYMQVFSKRYARKLVPFSSDIYNQQLTYRLNPIKDSKDGFVVMRIDNKIRKPLSLLVQLALGEDRYLPKLLNTAEMLTPEQPRLTYHINVEETDQVVQLDIGLCMKGVSATYSFEPANTGGGKQPPISPQLIYDKHYSQRFIYLSQKGRLSITFTKEADFSKKNELGPLSPWQESLPSIFSFAFNLASKSSVEGSSFDFSEVVSVRKNSQFVMILDGSVRIPRVEIQNLTRILQTHSLFVNYTLYLSTDERMTNFISKCHGYGVSYAEQYFDTSNHHTVSKWETITNESFYLQQKLIADSAMAKIKNSLDYIVLKPRVFGFGDIYKASVVAKVTFMSRADTATFPLGQQVEVSYGDFEIKGDKYGYLVLGAITFLVVLLATLCMAMCIRYGVIKPLFSRKFLAAFDTQAVADQLVLEIADYRQNMRLKALNTSLTSNTGLQDETRLDESFQTEKPEEGGRDQNNQ